MRDTAINPVDFARPEASPLELYGRAQAEQGPAWLRQVLQALERTPRSAKPREMADELTERLAEPGVMEALLARLPEGARLALGLFAVTEQPSMLAVGLAHCLGCLGVPQPGSLVRALLETGLLTADAGYACRLMRPDDDLFDESRSVELIAHPAAVAAAGKALPAAPALPRSGPVRQVREADGLEPILRLAALWQRVAEAPLRQTDKGPLYKRDRDRLGDDPVLAGPIADALEPLPDFVALCLALGRSMGLIAPEATSDRLIAAPAAYWAENAVHLPQMIATRWLVLPGWNELLGSVGDDCPLAFTLVYARPAILLWLATLGDHEWVALDDLAEHLDALWPLWDTGVRAERLSVPGRATARGSTRRGEPADPDASEARALDAILLGAAYQLGLVRAAEEVPSGRRVVQLTPLGRYVLALGPPPEPRPVYEHFLFVQPNFEVVAYRQGLNAALVGQFSRFARWSQIGAALELRLTPDSVYRGLEGGLSPDDMLARLARHSARPLPASVVEAVRTWAGRRDRITYYSAVTLMEFASAEALESALAAWPTTDRAEPVRVSDRLLLVEDQSAIPFQRFRLAGSRDYRQPPEACLDVAADGVTLTLDLGRSDLLVDAELARFTDELTPEQSGGSFPTAQRRFRVSAASLARAAQQGTTPGTLERWYELRTGLGLPPAVRLMLHAAGPKAEPFVAGRYLVLTAPSAEVLDGLVQHPATRDSLGDRLGPTAVIVPEEALGTLREALDELGLGLEHHAGSTPPAPALRLKRRKEA